MEFLRPASAFRLRRALLFACLSIVTVACGGDSDQSGQSGNPGSGTPPASSTGRRIAWDQVAPSLTEVRTYSFRLTVDGVTYGLTEVQCNAATSSGAYSCSAPLPPVSPGSHTFTMISVYRGVESLPSAPFTTVVSALTEGTTISGYSPATVSASTAESFDASALWTSMRPVGPVAELPDGRLLVVEEGSRIYIVRSSERLTRPALVREHALERLMTVLPSSDFEATGTLYVTSIEAGAAQRNLIVRQYRELEGALGEGAVVLTQPLGERDDALVQLDIQNNIYVALRSEQGGRVYRYTSDGGTPWSAGQTSPLLITVDISPKALAVHRDGSGLWLSGTDDTGNWRLLSVSLAGGVGVLADAIEIGQQPSDPAGVLSLGLASGPQVDGLSRFFLNDSDGRLYRMDVSGPSMSTVAIPLPSGDRAISVVPGSDGNGAFAVLHNPATGSFTVARLEAHQVARRE